MAMVCIGLFFLLLLQFRIVFKKGTREMSFTIYEPNGTMFIQWFSDIDKLISSMLKNPQNTYHRNIP